MFDLTEHDELIDHLHEKVSEGNLHAAKRIAETISAKARPNPNPNPNKQRGRTLAVA